MDKIKRAGRRGKKLESSAKEVKQQMPGKAAAQAQPNSAARSNPNSSQLSKQLAEAKNTDRLKGSKGQLKA